MKQKEDIRNMFNDISDRYDFLNHFLSMGVDYRWRKKIVKELRKFNPSDVLDVATGTGDLALLIAAEGNNMRVTGIDMAGNMLKIARKKATRKGLHSQITFVEGDVEAMPFEDESFDAVTVAFGVRNFENLEKGLGEMKRVLKQGGVMMILEFSQPESFPVRQLYHFYSRFMIPAMGRMVSGNSHAYTYLPESVAAFPSGRKFQSILEQGGMVQVCQHTFTFGIASLYCCRK